MCEVALITNLDKRDISKEFLEVLSKGNVEVITVAFESFRFPNDYKWSLAFYKLCVLKYTTTLSYDAVCYLDTDVFVQGSFDAIWKECEQNVLLYDINHGLNNSNYIKLCDEVSEYKGEKKLITHYGGEFFAANRMNAIEFCDICESTYNEIIRREFITTKGDEFIVSLAADTIKQKIKNAGAYIHRFWTGVEFTLISTCYEYNRVTVLYVPDEKMRGMLKMYSQYICKSQIPDDKIVFKIFHFKRSRLNTTFALYFLNIKKQIRKIIFK